MLGGVFILGLWPFVIAKCPNIFLLRSAASARYFFRSDLGSHRCFGSFRFSPPAKGSMVSRKLKERNCQFGSLPCLYRNYVKLQEIIYTSKLHLYCTEHHDLSWGNSRNSQSSWSFMKHRGNIMGKSAWIAWLEHRIHSGTPVNHQRSPECPLNFLVISLP